MLAEEQLEGKDTLFGPDLDEDSDEASGDESRWYPWTNRAYALLKSSTSIRPTPREISLVASYVALLKFTPQPVTKVLSVYQIAPSLEG